MTYPLIYLTLAALATILKTRAAQRAALIVALVPIFLFVATREWTGCDFGGYLRRYLSYAMASPEVGPLQALAGPEGLFSLLNTTAASLGLGYVGVNALCAAIFFLGLSRFALAREAPLTLLALAFPILTVQLAMSGIRQACATALLMLAFNAFAERRRAAMLLLVMLASLFHQTALMFAPLAFAVGRTLSLPKLAAGIALAAPAAVWLASARLEVYQERYGGGEVEAFGAALRVALIALTALLFVANRRQFARLYPRDYPLMAIFAVLGLALVPIALASSIAAHRIGYYVMPVHLLTLARLPRALTHGRPDALLEVMPLFVYGLYIVVWFAASRHAQYCYVPYDSYLF